MPKSLFIKYRCKKVVPDLGLPTITIGCIRLGLRAILKKTLSINKKAETINFIKNSKKPVISGASQAPKVIPTILYAVSFLLILNIV